MLIFEQREIPDGSLSDCLRQSIRSYAAPRGDEGDFHPLDWVQRLVQAHPETAPRVAAAYFELLDDADAGVVCDVLEQVPSHPADLAPQLMDFLCRHVEDLRTRDDVYRSDRTLLGVCVAALYASLRGDRMPTHEAARVLATLDRPEDGWPDSFLLALAADPGSQLPHLVPELQRMSPEQLESFVHRMEIFGPPLTTDAFDALARGPTDLRDRIAGILREWVAGAYAPSPLPKGPHLTTFEEHWGRYAARLDVAAS